ncbi:hypothetical protein GF382_02950 [Candidatus Falkowbacteria bacterium]|nr:hypothetical protein [Candidatus Falkowbacteria bacterium]
MKKPVILLVIVLVLLVLVFTTNFEYGSSLANLQDELFARYNSGGEITRQDIKRLESNRWVGLSYFLAPSNLVVRHYVLIDLARGEEKNKEKIKKLIERIAPQSVWLEGYSYWLYTKPFLQKYVDEFELDDIQIHICAIDTIFEKTAYHRNTKLYPAPFGDVRDIPLEGSSQDSTITAEISIGIIEKNNDIYNIKPAPLGFNLHTPDKEAEIKIVDGIPENFEFYEGYSQKYKNAFEELIDMLDLKRIFSIFR